MNNLLKACIFDLDGVLVDTAVYHYMAWKRLALKLGFDFTQEQNEGLKGISRMQSLEILLAEGGLVFDEAAKLKLADKKNRWYCEYIEKMTADEILPGAASLLKELKSKGIKTALGSASKNAETILRNTNLLSQFDVIVDGNNITKAKPDPQVFLLAAGQLKVKPEECVVFEDARAGIAAAVKAGMHSVGIGNPAWLNQADIVVPALKDISIDTLNNLFHTKGTSYETVY
ncbi:beta-phosphoglucomutase [Anaerocolumna jejuensis]|uniref:beta-phosphoglucomutase n=1 Tax=Anaerocolumna jejuensis TaxID=259063 RepID=UPI003F7C286A